MSRTGVVLLHGKWDQPPFAVAPLGIALNDAGFATRQSTYPWALRHRYDRPLAAAFDLIRQDIQQLRRAACERIVLCGHSLGASVALAFAAGGEDLDGLIVLAPGHFPERLNADGITRDALAEARAHADVPGRIPLMDSFQGTVRRLHVPAAPYLDYFDPDGPLVWPANMARLDATRPLLWVVGDKDPAVRLGIDYAFTHKKNHPLDRHVCLPADHVGTPTAASGVVVNWLRHLETRS